MAVVSAEVSRLGTGGSISRTGERRFVVYWNVKTDDPTDGVIAITEYFRVTPGLPFYGDEYSYFGETDANSFLERITPAKKDRSQFEWTVQLDYQERDQRQDELGNPTGDPLEQMRRFEFYFSPRQVAVEEAAFGGIVRKDPVTGNRLETFPAQGYYQGATFGTVKFPCNAAGDPLDPPLLKNKSDLLFTCRVNLPGYDADQSQQWIDKLNNADIQLDLSATIYKVHLKLYKFTAQLLSYNAIFQAETWTDPNGVSKTTYFWEHSYQVLIRRGLEFANGPPLGHRVWAENSGYNRSARVGDPDGLGGVIGAAAPAGRSITARILDADNVPVSEKVALDGNGQPLSAALDPVSVELNGTEVKDFTQLPGIGFTAWTP